MQKTSVAYKTEQKEHLRNEQYVYVYLGVVSKEAQNNAVIEGAFTDYSEPDKVTSNVPFEAYYATCEHNMARCDGSQYFMPRDNNLYALYQGAVTEDLSGTIRFTFGQYKRLNIKGLTIDFGDFYPTDFSVSNGDVQYTYRYTNDTNGVWTCDDEFLNTSFIQITPYAMVGGQQRLRILSIKFGRGFVFDNYNLISTSWKSEISHLSDSLPSRSFTFTIDNLSRNFSADNPHSWVAFLQEQQEVNFDYGRKMDDGSIYIITGGKLNLKSWSSSDTQAKFSAVGNFDYISSTYYRGQYYEDGISLYDLAIDVLNDAGIEEYHVDPYLKKVFTHNPLPVEKHKNLLQLIANSAKAILYEDRNGITTIKTSFVPDVTNIESNGHMPYSNLNGLLDADMECYEYASDEQNFVATDGHQYFMPRDTSSYLYGGYISSAISSEDGYFDGTSDNFIRFVHDDGTITGIEFNGDIETRRGVFTGDGIVVDFNEIAMDNPTITVEWEANWTFYNLTMVFSDVHPLVVVIHTYSENVLVESFEQNIDDINYLVAHSFYDIDKITFEFVRTNPYQRIHLKKIFFGDITDYTLEYTDMSTSPVATRTDFIRNINVVYSEYSYGTEVKNISTVAVVEEENTATYKTAYHDYSLAYKELTDDEETYTKVSKVFCDSLPPVEEAKSSARYFVKTGLNQYDMYTTETVNKVKSWRFLSVVTEEIVNSLPSTLTENKLYLVTTDKELIYHLYMLDDTGNETRTISLGYDVRGTLTIIDSGAYFVSFTSNVSSPVVVSGIAFLINERTYTNELHELGEDKTANNVLIDNYDHAKDESEWLAEYFNNDVEYKIQYRGEPALDPDDQIYIENKFVEKNLVRITSTQIDTSTGMSMSCVLNGRRISYVSNTTAKADYALVDVSEVK